MYKEASKLGLTFQTPKGLLFPHQLWLISFPDLIVSIKEAKKLIDAEANDGELSFLSDTSTVNKADQLKFDILKDVFISRREIAKEQLLEREKKERNQKIIDEIAKRQNDFSKLSDAELKKLLEG